jgi:thiamine transporter ThiT
VKIPLLLYSIGSGLLSSLVTSFIKGVSELINSKDIVDHLQRPMIYQLLALVGVCLFYQLHFMNLNLKYYDQMEIIPIY